MENNELYEKLGRELYPLFFERNFGLATKSEIEGRMFNVYLNEKKESGEEFSDRYLSRTLGISESKVRNLKRSCFARFEDEISFPELLKKLANEESPTMFFKPINKNEELRCRITVFEIVYYDELTNQLTNSRIHFTKNPGSNYIELAMKDAIIFFSHRTISDESEELNNLINEMKKIDFKNDWKDVFKTFTNNLPGPIGEVVSSIFKLIKND